jgi:hypothetical protein
MVMMVEGPPPPALVLPMLPSDRQILQPANNNITLCILQGAMSTRAHIPPTRRWVDLKHLLFEAEPPAHGHFHGRFRQWVKNQRSRIIKEQVISLLLHL